MRCRPDHNDCNVDHGDDRSQAGDSHRSLAVAAAGISLVAILLGCGARVLSTDLDVLLALCSCRFRAEPAHERRTDVTLLTCHQAAYRWLSRQKAVIA